MFRIAKRTLDVIVSVFALLITAPVCALVAIAIWLTTGESPLFKQRRPGYRERPFTVVKFRTMRTTTDLNGCQRPDAERLTRLGRFLRNTSVDEIPQFWNVLVGDMSLVGPRPLLTQYLHRYNDSQRRRHSVKPGITGWAQVNGRNALSWEDKFRLDAWYVDHASMALDLKILCLTLLKVLRRHGIAQDGHATMPEFRGSLPS